MCRACCGTCSDGLRRLLHWLWYRLRLLRHRQASHWCRPRLMVEQVQQLVRLRLRRPWGRAGSYCCRESGCRRQELLRDQIHGL